jgi:hypothetical protein
MDAIRNKDDNNCEGCLAVTTDYLCDLGNKAWSGCRIGLKVLPCRIEDEEEYQLAHMRRM